MNIQKLQDLYFDFYRWGKRKVIAKGTRNKAIKHLNNKDILTPEEKKQAIDFWAPYAKIDLVYHAFFKEKTGKFCPENLPADIYLNQIDEYFNDRDASNVMDNKGLYSRLFLEILQPELVACRLNGFWYDKNWQSISLDQMKEILEKENAVFIKKATRSFGGKGVLYIDTSAGKLYDQVMVSVQQWREDIVIQRPLKQHACLRAINESSVNTIRLLSLLTSDGVKIYSAVLRMGLAGARVDNASSGGITCGITEDGYLKKYAYRPTGERFEKHPSSGVVFAGYQIQGFEKAKELVKKAHPMMPFFRMISWDLALNEQGDAVMIEANFAKGELDFHQLNNGPLFGEDTKKVLDEVFGIKR